MPNWTNNDLVILVPDAKAEALKEALSGPEDWFYPTDALHAFEREAPETSRHEELRISADVASLAAQFKAHHADHGWPQWMKPGPTDLRLFLKDPDYLKSKNPTTPFSVARLRPWTDKSEFDSFFPEKSAEAPVWTGDSASSAIIEMRRAFIGTKWPPSNIDMQDITAGNRRRITIKYDTPWCPIGDLASLIDPVLAAHDAKALLLWVEEADSSGFEYINPQSWTQMQQDFANDGFVETITDPMTDESMPMFDQEKFETYVLETIDDPDFQPA